jgi:hypothetical protein
MENKKLTPGFFFMTLGVVATLVTTVVAFLNLIFETLNRAMPDVLSGQYTFGYQTYDYEAIRSSLATLIIAFPAYLILSYFWTKFAHTGKLSEYNTWLRKWMMYLVLFIVAVTALIDLVVLVRYFVSGEITLRFVLKVLAVLVTSGLVGGYYIQELRSELGKPARYGWVFISVSVVCFFAVIIYSFTVMGSPIKQRALRLDQKRIEDLQNIQSQVVTFWQQKEKLPATLAELIDPLQNWQTLPRDPEFSDTRTYEYKKTGDKTFELCATFTEPIPQGWHENTGGGVYPIAYDGKDIATSAPVTNSLNESWDHQAGRTCFTRTIDPERYPPFSNPTPIKGI